MSKKRRLALWLCPPEKEAECWRKLIQDLAQQNGAPEFEPHVSLLGPVLSPPEEIAATIRELSAEILPLELKILGVETGETFYQSVFVRLERSSEILSLQKAFSERLEHESVTAEFPHLSLVYSSAGEEEKEKIASKIEFSFGQIQLTRVELWDCSDENPSAWSRS